MQLAWKQRTKCAETISQAPDARRVPHCKRQPLRSPFLERPSAPNRLSGSSLPPLQHQTPSTPNTSSDPQPCTRTRSSRSSSWGHPSAPGPFGPGFLPLGDCRRRVSGPPETRYARAMRALFARIRRACPTQHARLARAFWSSDTLLTRHGDAGAFCPMRPRVPPPWLQQPI